MTNDVFLFDAVRTPRGRGRPGGGLHEVKPIDLVGTLLQALERRSNLDTERVDDIILGVVNPIGEQGSVLPKSAALSCGWSQRVCGVQLNRFCASGLEAINTAVAKIAQAAVRIADIAAQSLYLDKEILIMSKKPSVAIIGGTGALGTGLARRWALAGYPITIGSRRAENASKSAQELSTLLDERGVTGAIAGAENVEAARTADIVVLTVPFSQHADMLDRIREAVQGRLVLDTTAPLVPPRVGTVQFPQAGSAAVSTQTALGENVSVVSAFQTVAADKLQSLEPMDGDVLVCGNKREDCGRIIELVEAIGMRGLYGGPLANSAASEALTSVLITINRQFKCQAGIKLVGLK